MKRWEWERALRAARGVSSTQKLVGLMLATYADHTGADARPGTERLAEDTDLSGRSVRDALAMLRELGWVERVVEGTKHGRRAVVDEYRLALPSCGKPLDHRKQLPVIDEGTPAADDKITGTSRPDHRKHVPPTGTGPEQHQTNLVDHVRDAPGECPVDNRPVRPPRRRKPKRRGRGPPTSRRPRPNPSHRPATHETTRSTR